MTETSRGRQDHMTATGTRSLRPLLAGAGALLAAGVLAAPAHAAFPGTNGKIAFENDPQLGRTTQSLNYLSASSLFTMSAAGTDPTSLLAQDDTKGAAADPSVSPDGKQVAYVRSGWSPNESYFTRVHVANLDGTADHQAIADDDLAAAPAWSPDGKQLVYVQIPPTVYLRSGAQSAGYDTLRIANADGSGEPTTVNLGDWDSGDADNPQWSPDGKWIAFDNGHDVFVVPATGGTPTNITNAGDNWAMNPNWAPDGSALAYEIHGYQSAAIQEVPFENGKPGDPVDIVDANWVERPAYSPDGLKITWSGFADNLPQTPLRTRTLQGRIAFSGIFVANVDGTKPKEVTSGTSNLTAPDWQPIPIVKPPVKQPDTQQPHPPVVTVTPSTGGVKGVTSYRCGSRRDFVIRLRPRGSKIVMARVIVNGKRVMAHPGKRWTARVDLRTLPKKRFKVDVTVWTKSGKRFHETRRYWTCTPAR